MKKSFKKAGAAVLSMAMLLSMGAMSMPVYADNPTGATPGRILVEISGFNGDSTNKQGEGKDDTSSLNNGQGDGLTGKDSAENSDGTGYRYDYLKLNNVTEATVKMYKVANFGADGWTWAHAAFKTAAETAGNGFTSWESLFDVDANNEFTTKSSDLKKLSSALEQAIPNGYAEVDSAVINYADGQRSVYLPTNQDELKDKTGYYLIVTETNQAGVIVQPVLISLKNGAENPKKISLKGTTIDVNKKITKVVNKDNDTFEVDDAVTGSGKSAVVAKDDKVHYEIYARLPKYDANATEIADFIIEDIADDGLIIDTATQSDPTKENIQAYLSYDNEEEKDADSRLGSAGNNWKLTRGSTGLADYTLEARANGGFRFIIDKAQLRGTSNGSTSGDRTINKTGQTTMENLYLIISFDATIKEDKFNKGEMADYEYKDLAAGDLNQDKELILEILSGMKTRYQSKDVTYTNDALLNMVKAKDSSVDDITKLINNVTGKVVGTNDADIIAMAKDYVVDGIADTDPNLEGVAKAMGYIADTETIAGLTPGELENTKAVLAVLKEHYIKAIIALDYKNATKPIGEHNRATMTYGNNYSTGKGSAVMPTDVTTVYSVDADFTKFAQGLALTAHTPKADAYEYKYDEIVDFLKGNRTGYDSITGASDALAKLALEVKTDDVAATPTTEVTELLSTVDDAGDADAISAMNSVLGVTGASTDEQKNAAKLAVALIKKFNKDKGYDANATADKVVGAVFELYKVYDEGSANRLSLGYAVSDESGKLKLLIKDPDTYAAEPDSVGTGEGNVAYFVKNGDNDYTYYKVGTKDAWTTLTTGDYALKEISAPAGYKVWDNEATFKINAEKTANEYNGKYNASGTGTAYSAVEDTSVTQNFETTFLPADATNPNGKGLLSAKIYDKPQDKLPATGGIGTVLFTAGGISIVLIAGALFVMYMKKRNAEDEE